MVNLGSSFSMNNSALMPRQGLDRASLGAENTHDVRTFSQTSRKEKSPFANEYEQAQQKDKGDVRETSNRQRDFDDDKKLKQDVSPDSIQQAQTQPIDDRQSIDKIKKQESALEEQQSLVSEKSVKPTESHLSRIAEHNRNQPDPLTQRVALQSFMHKMKSEAGVSAQNLMSAFQQLTPQELQLPPELNVNKIVQALNLKPSEEIKATYFFEKMLSQSASSSLAEYVKDTGTNLSLELMTKTEAREKALQDSLSQMTNSFFVDGKKTQQKNKDDQQATAASMQNIVNELKAMQGPEAGSEMGKEIVGEVSGEITGETKSEGDSEMSSAGGSRGDSFGNMAAGSAAALRAMSFSGQQPSSLVAAPALAGHQNMPASNTQMTDAQFLNQMNASNSEELESLLADKSMQSMSYRPSQIVSDEAILSPYSINPSLPQMNMKARAFQQYQSQSAMSGAAPGAEVSEGANGLFSMAATDADTESEFNEQDLDGSEFHEGMMQNGQKMAKTSGKEGQDFMMARPTVTPSEEAANVRNIVNETRQLIRQGGGEMRLKLNPEGIGEVSIKVASENGQLNVEMVTESNDAKKLLEKGLGELKATLASHRLNVDQIKVDVSSQIAQDLLGKNDESERHFQQQFLSDFRQQNQGFRRNFFDIPGARPLPSQLESDGDSVASPLDGRQKKQSHANRRLDLVA